MIKDPFTRWPGLFPYDALAPVGVTPHSSLREVLDASFELMARGLMTPEVREAWDRLRDPQKRQFVDFFLYPLDAAAEAARCRRELDECLAELPGRPDVSDLLRPRPADLEAMRGDTSPLPAYVLRLKPEPEPEGAVELSPDDFARFDR
jgi:hypothetical protein